MSLQPTARTLAASGLPMHGVPWSKLVWTVTEASRERITAQLDWTRPELLAIFPFPHRIELAATLRRAGLTVETTLVAGAAGAVPVAFGFHPYVGLTALPRDAGAAFRTAFRICVGA